MRHGMPNPRSLDRTVPIAHPVSAEISGHDWPWSTYRATSNSRVSATRRSCGKVRPARRKARVNSEREHPTSPAAASTSMTPLEAWSSRSAENS
jgi:hypothetical protein